MQQNSKSLFKPPPQHEAEGFNQDTYDSLSSWYHVGPAARPNIAWNRLGLQRTPDQTAGNRWVFLPFPSRLHAKTG